MKHLFTLLALTSLCSAQIIGQNEPFQIEIEAMTIPNLGGVQSFAWGQSDGKWLILGGRLDGLHMRQPNSSFDVAGHNNQIIVVDPVTLQKWSAPLTSLPTSIQEQLSSTNMQFHQEGAYLYVTGGYGYSATAVDHTTYPNLSAVNVPNVINAVINNSSFVADFRQVTDTHFAVTGGYLNKINNTYYLTGGHKFIGRYNPMGPNNGPGFIQEYTNAMRRFTINDDGTNLTINHLPEVVDAASFHRRDYNVIPQILPGGNEGLTIFSGVFQQTADLPYLNCVNIDSIGHTINPSFSQYYNHYHCAHIPLYSTSSNEMHNLFFGGIAQYFDDGGTLTQDNNVPFVNTIARVSREANGTMTEYKLPITMPQLLGAGSEFIPIENLPYFNNHVLKLDGLTADTTLLGYIYGGISSTAANIFFTNTGVESSASSQIFKVYLIQDNAVGVHQINDHSTNKLQMQVYPNPTDGVFQINFNTESSEDVTISVHSAEGKLISSNELSNLNSGPHSFLQSDKIEMPAGIYYITLQTNNKKATQRLIIK